ncbi:MAG: glycogen/starch synthase, partial [Dietzia cercidiphylli]
MTRRRPRVPAPTGPRPPNAGGGGRGAGGGGAPRAGGAGLDLLVIDAPHLFDRPGNPYLAPDGRDWPDNPQRFAALCWVAAQVGVQGVAGWRPDVLHGHDWQAGLVPEYLRRMDGPVPPFVLTIHNIAFTGPADPGLVDALRLDPNRFHSEGYEYWGA